MKKSQFDEHELAIIEMVKLGAKKNGGAISENFKNFNIKDPVEAYEIAKLCAENNGGVTSEHFKNFGITDPDKKYEIAELCALQDPYTTDLNKENFELEFLNSQILHAFILYRKIVS